MFIKIEELPGNSTSSIFRFFRPFFTDIICSQSLCCENFTITMSLSLLRWWHASMSCGDIYLTILVSTLSSNWLFWALSGIATTSRHSLVECWVFAWHCLSISTNFSDNNELPCFATLFSASSWLNFRFNWCTWLRILLFVDSTLLWNDSRIVMSSFLFNLS